MTPDFDAIDRESGRKLFAAPWDFVHAAASLESLPPMQGTEIALAGRSNVGKSSLLNALTGRKALARMSHTPGRTQELIFFRSGAPVTIVDMPGYGYAEAPKAKVKAWTSLIHSYLQGRANLRRVYLLVDARHGLKSADEPVLKALDEAAVSYAVVLTKSDQVSASALEECLRQTAAALAKHSAAYPDIIATSSRTGDGMEELRAAIAKLLREHAER